MRKTGLIACGAIALIGLTAFTVTQFNDSTNVKKQSIKRDNVCSTSSSMYFWSPKKPDIEFIYALEPRFLIRVTEKQIAQAKNVDDIIPEFESKWITSYSNIQVSSFIENQEEAWTKAFGENKTFTETQLSILRDLDYGSSFSITGSIQKKDEVTGQIKKDTLVYYMTMLPDHPTEYVEGNESLIKYLKKNSRDAILVAQKDKLSPGKISFIVSKEGKIDRVNLISSSGYDTIDKKMLQLIKDLPGEWRAAKNSKGEMVDQELVFFFGQMGC